MKTTLSIISLSNAEINYFALKGLGLKSSINKQRTKSFLIKTHDNNKIIEIDLFKNKKILFYIIEKYNINLSKTVSGTWRCNVTSRHDYTYAYVHSDEDTIEKAILICLIKLLYNIKFEIQDIPTQDIIDV